MKKKFVVIALFILVSFGIGSFVGAQSASIVDTLFDKANREIGATGMAKKEEIVKKMEKDLTDVVQAKLNAHLNENKTEVELALEAYYAEKLAGIENSEEFKTSVTELDTMAAKAIAYYKAEIDKAFASK
jgi:hypothetical protein